MNCIKNFQHFQSTPKNPGSTVVPTLCFPDGEKTCFACCPPIRPAGYQHIDYKSIMKRILRENTRSFAEKGTGVIPITGFSCWALGYLDENCRQVGCLLHPARNAVTDLRYRVDYGEKCRRETCPEAKVFLQLDIPERKFWLQLTQGLDSFSYSSKKRNPLFAMLGWGAETLKRIVCREGRRTFTKQAFFETYPFFETALNPRADAYLIRELLRVGHPDLLKQAPFGDHFKVFSNRLSDRLKKTVRIHPHAPPTHRLKLDPLLLDFLRLRVGLTRIDEKSALQVKEMVDRAVREFEGKVSVAPGARRFQVGTWKR
ncbi:MAG: hypothetical protein R6V46_11880 [Desulfatiglandaceae bacterium]